MARGTCGVHQVTRQDEEEFERLAYAYRSWPIQDPAGVALRFADLKEWVEEMIQNEATAAADHYSRPDWRDT